jgi:hypothetical protein
MVAKSRNHVHLGSKSGTREYDPPPLDPPVSKGQNSAYFCLKEIYSIIYNVL